MLFRPLRKVAASLALVGTLSLPACALLRTPTPATADQVRSIADRVVTILDAFQWSVIEAESVGWLDTATARRFVQMVQDVLPLIQASPGGAPAVTRAALDRLRVEILSSDPTSRLLPWIDGALAALEALS